MSMKNCTSLNMIDVGENRLTGRIPTWMGDSFSELIVLILRSNEFDGSIPSNLCRLANIQILDISSNMISGAIPECVQDYVVMTREHNDVYLIDLLWGIISFPLEDMLYSLYPKSFESAYFMWKGKEVKNHLTGSIPISLGDMSHLGVLDLSYYNLSGRIPQSNQGLTFDESAYVGEPKDDSVITEGFYIALGLDFIVGFWGILGTMFLNGRFRHAFFNEGLHMFCRRPPLRRRRPPPAVAPPPSQSPPSFTTDTHLLRLSYNLSPVSKFWIFPLIQIEFLYHKHQLPFTKCIEN
ncbi:Receptor-like protein EIX2 [Sesamum alatum]|uniref:Receptor-like protein EIX2 n=1 Tax=Sesamum alatum TaxID=300844 RepID=A0AAE1XS37_9LAMI|nr:Receptor-like protein EIX2 [Sesamum alatum]